MEVPAVRIVHSSLVRIMHEPDMDRIWKVHESLPFPWVRYCITSMTS